MEILGGSGNENKNLVVLEKKSHFILSELCRLCGNSNRNVMPIYDGEGLQNELGRKIEKHLLVQVSENDYLPQQVCYHCARTVLAWHDLAENFLKVEEKFHEIVRDMGHMKGVECKNGSEVTQLAALEYSENEKSVSYSKSTVEEKLLSTSDEIVRSQDQDCQTISLSKTGDIMNSTFKLFEHQEVKAVEDIIFSHPVISHDSNSKMKYYSLYIDKGNNSSCFTNFPSLESTKPTNRSSSVFPRPDDDSVKDPCAVAPIRNEVLCLLTENTCGTRNFQLKLDHDYVLPDDNSLETLDHNDSLPRNIMTVEPQQPHIQLDICNTSNQFNYRLQFRKNTENLLHIIVHWKRCRNSCVVVCENCERSFKTWAVLLTHSRFHARRSLFYCKFCGKRFYLSSSLKKHLKECPDTKRRLRVETVSHHVTKESDNRYACASCGKKYKLKESLRDHVMQHMGKGRPKLKCEICSEKFLRKAEILDHMKCHDTSAVLSCTMCNKIVLNEKELQNHQISHTSIRPFTCNVCTLTYKRKSHLTRHLLVHSTSSSAKSKRPPQIRHLPGQEYKCNYCDKVSRTKHLHALHMISHTGERNYECVTCGKRFGQSGALTRHVRTVHVGAKDFKCEVCNRSFTAKATKENHMRIHTGEKPFQCTECGKTFRTQQQHKLHEKIHSDVRPYSCQYCSKQFRRRPHLVIHIRTHTGEKPYGCPTCGRSFAQKNDMTKHMNIHKKAF